MTFPPTTPLAPDADGITRTPEGFDSYTLALGNGKALAVVEPSPYGDGYIARTRGGNASQIDADGVPRRNAPPWEKHQTVAGADAVAVKYIHAREANAVALSAQRQKAARAISSFLASKKAEAVADAEGIDPDEESARADIG